MKLNIVYYSNVLKDRNGHRLPVGSEAIASQDQAAFGPLAAAPAGTLFARVVCDTDCKLTKGGIATTFYAKSPDFIEAKEGDVFTSAAN